MPAGSPRVCSASKVVPFVCGFVGSVIRNKLRQRTDNLYDIMKNPGAASKKGSILIERSMDADVTFQLQVWGDTTPVRNKKEEWV